MPMPRHALAAAFAAVLTLSAAGCARDAGNTATDAAAPDAPPAADAVAPPAGGTETPSDDAAMALPATDAAQPDAAGNCNAEAVQSLVGQEATDAVLEQAKRDSGSNLVRALRPGEAATMDFRPDRLDIALDDNSIIQSLRCG